MSTDFQSSPPSSSIRRKLGMSKSAFIAILFAFGVTIWVVSGFWTNPSSPEASDIPNPQEKAEKAEKQKTSVRVTSLQAEEMIHTIKINGLTQASRTVNLTSEISGKISLIHKEEGSVVDKGDTIISITTEDRTSLVRRAEKTVEQRRIELESARELHKKNFVSDVRLAEARAALEEAEAHFERAKVNLDNTTIHAPFKGIVDTVHVEIGDVVAPGTHIATLLDLMPTEFVVYVSEKNIRNVKPGTQAQAIMVDGREIPLIVTYVAAMADPQTRTFQVKLTYPNDNLDVVAGMTTRVVLPVGTEMAHFIPPSILTLNEEGQVGVKAVNDEGTVLFHPVEILQSTQKGIWVNNLPESLNIIVVGQEFVAAGEQVNAEQTDSLFLPVQNASAGES